MIILPGEFNGREKQLGPKAYNLDKLKTWGFNVPDFLAVPSFTTVSIWEEKQTGRNLLVNKLAGEIIAKLNCQSYAVRSSALIEDSQKSSMAGQFLTKTNVKKEELAGALLEVTGDAHNKLGGDLELFSIIIQKYISPDYSGVAFTRSPLGGREMVIEYHRGSGEDLVSGKIKPNKYKAYWAFAGEKEPLPKFKVFLQNVKKIENLFKFPQDIEWCLKNGEYFFLQARPQTAIKQSVYEQNLYLDKTLPAGKTFYYEKTEIAEIAPRPKAFALSLLKKIYGADGPVKKVYEKYGINYFSLDFFVIVGNELYSDRNIEIKTLLPSFEFSTKSQKPHFKTFKNSLQTLKNLWKLNLIPLKADIIEKKIKNSLAEDFSNPAQSLASVADNFFKDYELIFEANLLAEKAFKNFSFIAKKFNLNPGLLLSGQIETNIEITPPTEKMLGNSLDISDTSPFFSRLTENKTREAAVTAINRLTPMQKARLNPSLLLAGKFNRLREYGRWLTVKHISLIREKLEEIAAQNHFKDSKNIHFFSLEEILPGKCAETEAIKRKNLYEPFLKFELPKILSSEITPPAPGLPLAVSPGIAQGKLIPLSEIETAQKPAILYTKILSPDIAGYFPKISGIISEQGGMLSHLAIMARENSIPVLTNINLSHTGINLGDVITLDADNSQILKN